MYRGATVPVLQDRMKHILKSRNQPERIVLPCGGNHTEQQTAAVASSHIESLVHDIKCQTVIFWSRKFPLEAAIDFMSNEKLVKKLYCDLVEINDQGSTTRATNALKLVYNLGLDLNDAQKTFEINCKHAVQSNYIATRFANLHDIQSNPILRTYSTIKYEYSKEPYLHHVI